MNGGRLICAPALKAGVIEPKGNVPAARLAQLLEHYRTDLVLDIGANEGEYGRQLRRSGFKGHIVSYEPLPAAYGVLESRSRSDLRWDGRNLALSEIARPKRRAISREITLLRAARSCRC